MYASLISNMSANFARAKDGWMAGENKVYLQTFNAPTFLKTLFSHHGRRDFAW